MNEEKKEKPVAMSLKQLSLLYNVDERTFKNWLSKHQNKIGERIGNIYTPKQVSEIFNALGEP